MTNYECISASRRLVPGWDRAELNVRSMHGGLSNKLFYVQVQDRSTVDHDAPTSVVMRLFCTAGDLIDRAYEQRVFAFLAKSGFGPKVYGTDHIWRAEEYFPGTALNVQQLSEPETLATVGDLLAQFHTLSPPLCVAPDRSSTVLNLVDRWVHAALQIADKHDNLAQRLTVAKVEFDSTLRPLLKMVGSPIVFCHNDAQEGNVLQSEKGDFFLIDYEYAGWNFRGYDLANVLCECIIDNNAVAEATGFAIRPDLQPSQKALELMARSYLKRLNGVSASEQHIDQLLKEIRLFQPVSHILWASWAAAKTWSSPTIQFGYREYAEARLDLFDQDMSRK